MGCITRRKWAGLRIEKRQDSLFGIFVNDYEMILERIGRAMIETAEFASQSRKHEFKIGRVVVGHQIDVDIDPGTALGLQKAGGINILTAISCVHPQGNRAIDLVMKFG